MNNNSRKRSFAFVMILVFILMSTSCENRSDKIRRELNDGIRANYATKFDLAIKHFEKVISWDENNKEAYLNMGRVYFNTKNTKKSMESYNMALSIDSTFGEAYKSRAQLYFLLGDRDLSCRDYLKAEKYGIPNLYNYTKFCK